ncbi:Dynein heavy chain domain-containing protein 1 [Liparis tanakae]|uniref:Dynein heavy chain domain-containing protein 1 n=1 Tax=Liparis tanakae TaxID=230148 RepID=A0A4Z2EPP9_9TELE|nr:Dynein heavy chain domain-containing protein 1 [Liparis tanakae]
MSAPSHRESLGGPQSGSKASRGLDPGGQKTTLPPLRSMSGPLFSPLSACDRLPVGQLSRLGVPVGPGRAIGATGAPGGVELYYLKEVQDSGRPYDLQVVRFSDAGREHYVFSRHAVLHVTEHGHGGVVSLARWGREAAAWRALQEIRFFRDFRLRRAFNRWQRNVRAIVFQRKCWGLQDQLLVAVPPFREALLLFVRVAEEVQQTPPLPLDGFRTFTLPEFMSRLASTNQELLQTLERFSRRRAVLLTAVKQRVHEDLQRLQLHLERANKASAGREQPLHLLAAHRQRLREDSARARGALLKLGRFAALVDRMTLQSLVTAAQRGAAAFLSHAVQRPPQRALFLTELSFSAGGPLVLDPPVTLFQEAVSGALQDAGAAFPQVLSQSRHVVEKLWTYSTIKLWIHRREDVDCDASPGRRMSCCSPPLGDPAAAPGLSALGGRPLLRERLRWLLGRGDEAGLQLQRRCESFSWLPDAQALVLRWTGPALASMEGRPAAAYLELVEALRRWALRVQEVPSSFSAGSRLLEVRCSGLKERLGLQLRRLEEDVLQRLLERIRLLSGGLLADLEEAAERLAADPRGLQQLSAYAALTRASGASLAATQTRLDYVHALQDAVAKAFRQRTGPELALEEKLRAAWTRLVPLVERAEGVVSARRPPVADALDSMFSFLARDLRRRVSEATSGAFLDPSQEAQHMAARLKLVREHVHDLIAKLQRLGSQSHELHGESWETGRSTDL